MQIRLGFLMFFAVAAGAALYIKSQATQAPVAQVIKPPTEQIVSSDALHFGGPFTLNDQTGKLVNEQSWPGMYKLVFFGFTHCPAICPTTLQKMNDLLSLLGADNKIQPVFITVDPERDTVDVMANYVSSFNPKIAALTGTKEQVQGAMSAYRVYATKLESHDGQAGYMVDHSAFIYLMSPEDKPLAIFRQEDTVEKMVKVIQSTAHVAQDVK